MFVYVCSPYGGLQENYENAVEYCKWVAQEGHTPVASHVMLHGILSDDCPLQRKQGLAAGLELLKIVDEVWVFGDRISRGMAGEIAQAAKLEIPVVSFLGVRDWEHAVGSELLFNALAERA
jgi:hypothetical protein